MAGKVSNKLILSLSVFWLAASLIGAANAQPAQSRKMKRKHQHCRLGTLAREKEREREEGQRGRCQICSTDNTAVLLCADDIIGRS